MKPRITAISIIAIMTFARWYSGADLLERSYNGAQWFVVTVIAAALGYFFAHNNGD